MSSWRRSPSSCWKVCRPETAPVAAEKIVTMIDIIRTRSATATSISTRVTPRRGERGRGDRKRMTALPRAAPIVARGAARGSARVDGPREHVDDVGRDQHRVDVVRVAGGLVQERL